MLLCPFPAPPRPMDIAAMRPGLEHWGRDEEGGASAPAPSCWPGPKEVPREGLALPAQVAGVRERGASLCPRLGFPCSSHCC